ncbi:hypothetical protein DYB32_006059, partial [Aphanomyces invadans]
FRKTISLAGKVAIIEEYEASGGTIYATAKKHGIQCNQLSRWLKNKENLVAAASLNPSKVTLNPGKAPAVAKESPTHPHAEDGVTMTEEETSRSKKKRKRSPSPTITPPVTMPPSSPASTVSCPSEPESSFLKARRSTPSTTASHPPNASQLRWEATLATLTAAIQKYNEHQERLVDLHRERLEQDRDLKKQRLAVDTRLADIAEGHLVSIQELLGELRRQRATNDP